MITLEQDKAGPAEYIEIADMLQSELGGLDAIIHASADSGTSTPQMAIEHAEWVRVMNVNLTSARLLSLYCIPMLSQSELGSITFLLDDKTSAYWGGYGVSKSALLTFMRMLADEHDSKLGADGHPLVAINGYDPGPMRTPLRRRAFPGELEVETVLPVKKLGPLLSLLSREDRAVTGQALNWSTSEADLNTTSCNPSCTALDNLDVISGEYRVALLVYDLLSFSIAMRNCGIAIGVIVSAYE